MTENQKQHLTHSLSPLRFSFLSTVVIEKRQKKKLIFSQKFLETLSDKIKSILLQNEELNEFGLWDHIFLKEKFEFPENLIQHSSQ